MKQVNIFLRCIFLFLYSATSAQEIPSHQVIQPAQLANYLKKDAKKQINKEAHITQEALGAYLRQ